MSKLTVCIVGSNGNCQYAAMYESKGWDVQDALLNADLVQFTGGSDVDPSYYGEPTHPTVFPNKRRDSYEKEVYDVAKQLDIPCVGICRGGQFLNVLNDGKLYQDVDNHAIHGTHTAIEAVTLDEIEVTSTHHQMMRPAPDGRILMYANNRATKKEYYPDGENLDDAGGKDVLDVEAVHYADTNTLCFQPHPEMMDMNSECVATFFDYIAIYLRVGKVDY